MQDLASKNTPASTSDHMPVDLFHTVDGRMVMGDLKTIQDFMGSYTDGRLHSQITAMQKANCWFYYLLIIGDPTSLDGGYTVGDGSHGWTWDGFDDAILDVEVFGGVKIIRAPTKGLVARRLHYLWKWTGKDEAASWHSPVPVQAYASIPDGIIFYDEVFRQQVGSTMQWPGWGLKNAYAAREAMSYMDLHGITEAGAGHDGGLHCPATLGATHMWRVWQVCLP